MFRADRIGTPNIDEATGVGSAAAWVVNSSVITLGGLTGNVANGTPGGEFSRAQVQWTGAARTIPAGEAFNILQQFTITQPIDGDTVGVEVIGGIIGRFSAVGLAIRPVLGRITTAAGALWGAVQFSSYPTPLGPGATQTAVTALPHYLTQVIHRQDRSTIGGTYGHGFQIYNPTGAPITFDLLDIVLSERQLAYQESVGYRDTLR